MPTTDFAVPKNLMFVVLQNVLTYARQLHCRLQYTAPFDQGVNDRMQNNEKQP